MSHASFQRRTLAAAARVEGLGLFTGQRALCTMRPAPAGHGLTLARADTDTPLPATIGALSSQTVHPAFAQIPPRHTTLAGAEGPPFFTTEHLLAALTGLGITDAAVLLEGPEFPIGDGSASLFTDEILAAGLADLPGQIAPCTLTEPLRIESPDGRAAIIAEPSDRAIYRYELDYGPGAPLPPQAAEWAGSPEAFVRDVAPARTFSLSHEAAQMQALGLFRNFTPRDLLVVDTNGQPIDNAWRFPDEPARHKLLDLIGDLALVGRPILARVTAVRAGHSLNHAMARAMAGLAR